VAADPLARAARALLAVALAALASGCVTPPMSRYAWGGYEDVIYVAETKPGTLPPEAQVQQLERDREAARATHQRLPPGWHAHLSYLYYQMGRADLAREELLAEKTEFPEAATFVDHLLANLAGGAPKAP
jgi:hypothetical protein